MDKIGELIINTAKKYVGQTEKPMNSGFNDKDFEKKMLDVGWNPGEAWCAYFAELVWREAYRQYKPNYDPILNTLFSGSVMKTFNNFHLARYEVTITPKAGALAFWQLFKNGVATRNGHIGIYITSFNGSFTTIEGNTNSQGGREGFEVAVKRRNNDAYTASNGLRLIGFINPKT